MLIYDIVILLLHHYILYSIFHYVINTLLHYFYWILLNIIVYATSVWPWSCQSRISLYIIVYYWIFLNIIEYYWILLNVTEYYWILLYIRPRSDHDFAKAEYYWILLNTPPQSNHDLAIAEDDCGERNHEPGQSRSYQRTLNWNIWPLSSQIELSWNDLWEKVILTGRALWSCQRPVLVLTPTLP